MYIWVYSEMQLLFIQKLFFFLPSIFVPDKSLRESLDKILMSGYFDRVETKQNGACETEEKLEEQTAVDETAVTGEQPPEPGNQSLLCSLNY